MKRFLKSLWREEKGFTLIEFMIISLLMALAAALAAADWAEVWIIIQEIIQLLGG